MSSEYPQVASAAANESAPVMNYSGNVMGLHKWAAPLGSRDTGGGGGNTCGSGGRWGRGGPLTHAYAAHTSTGVSVFSENKRTTLSEVCVCVCVSVCVCVYMWVWVCVCVLLIIIAEAGRSGLDRGRQAAEEKGDQV